MKTLILILIYILGIQVQYMAVRIIHSENGVYENEKPNGTDVFIMFIPIGNLIAGLMLLIQDFIYKNSMRKGIDCSIFFKIKRKDR